MEKSFKAIPLREVRSNLIGHLVTVQGIVTRVTEVKPLLQVATYICDQCGALVHQEVSAINFQTRIYFFQ